MPTFTQKQRKLERIIDKLGSVAVAFSGGVDSSLLLAVCHQRLGRACLAATARSSTFPSRERDAAGKLAKQLGVRHVFFRSEELEVKGFSSNPPLRCYYCKRALLGKLKDIARRRRLAAVVTAENTDDLGDYRPGLRAEKELGIRRPLLEAGLSKRDVRRLAKKMGLAIWDKPASACLASRFPYGEVLSAAKFRRVEEAEDFLLGLGFRQVRVRHHGGLGRIEVEAKEIRKLMAPATRKRVERRLRRLGFSFVCVDLAGFESGSMNRTLRRGKR